MQEKSLTGEESFHIIQQMIEVARQEQKDDGLGWILWGWLLFIASLASFFNTIYGWVSSYFFWNVFGSISLLLLMYTSISFFFRKKRVKTYAKQLFDKLNVGFFINIMIIIISINLQGVSPLKGFAILLALYGFWCLVYGAAFHFVPSVLGAVALWICAFAALFVPDFKWTMLLHSLGVLLGYIIPGHLAYKQFKASRRLSAKYTA